MKSRNGMANSCGSQFAYAGFTEGREGGSVESLGPVEEVVSLFESYSGI